MHAYSKHHTRGRSAPLGPVRELSLQNECFWGDSIIPFAVKVAVVGLMVFVSASDTLTSAGWKLTANLQFGRGKIRDARFRFTCWWRYPRVYTGRSQPRNLVKQSGLSPNHRRHRPCDASCFSADDAFRRRNYCPGGCNPKIKARPWCAAWRACNGA